MPATELATAHQVARGALASQVATVVGAFWSRVDPNDIVASWVRMVPAVAGLISNGQLEAARGSDPFLTRLLGDIDAAGRVAPSALAGVAADGRPLVNLLMYPAWNTIAAITSGSPLIQSLAVGRAFLDLLARTQVADAGRQADLVAMAARPAVTSYIRVVESPACSRCILLAGNEYGISTGFKRHPRCDCTMEPVTKHHTPRPDSPKSLYDAMSPEQQRATFGEAGVKALAEGADMGQVVNARRGMGTATAYGRKVQATTEGITRRGIAGRRLQEFGKVPGKRYAQSRTPRLMPEEILDLADDRAHAIRLLKKHGYIV
jgi:hypothetical protein